MLLHNERGDAMGRIGNVLGSASNGTWEFKALLSIKFCVESITMRLNPPIHQRAVKNMESFFLIGDLLFVG